MLTAHAYVQGGGQHGGATVGQPVHHSDGRLRARRDLVAAAGAHGAASVHLVRGVLAVVFTLFVDVAARGERAAPGAGDDDAADALVGAGADDCLVKLGAQLMVHGVEVLGTIHREDRHTLHLFHDDVVGHAFLLSGGIPRHALGPRAFYGLTAYPDHGTRHLAGGDSGERARTLAQGTTRGAERASPADARPLVPQRLHGRQPLSDHGPSPRT